MVRKKTKDSLLRGNAMEKRLRILMGVVILLITAGSAITISYILPTQTYILVDQINADLIHNAQIRPEDDFRAYNGPDDTNYSDWMYTGVKNEDSNFTVKTRFEFYNVSDRYGWLYLSSSPAYQFPPGRLIFDVVINKTVIDYNTEHDYVVYGQQKQYIYNKDESTAGFKDSYVLNYNYLWPYYIEKFGNGTEYGFQAYIASYLLHNELQELQDRLALNEEEIAHLALNRNYAQGQFDIQDSVYIPHNWIDVRPAYIDLGFDAATSYQILYNATYEGKNLGILNGDPGATKFFLDLVKGLYYDQTFLSISPEQLLADVYNIDTPAEIQYAKSLAAYLEFLLVEPALDWLWDNQISYVARRTTWEWLFGVNDVLLGNNKFPIIRNITATTFDTDSDMYYMEKMGLHNVSEVSQIRGIANIPGYTEAHTLGLDYDPDTGLAYAVEGKRGLKISNTTHPLFLAIGQYKPSGEDFRDVAVEKTTAGNTWVYTVSNVGLKIINADDPENMELATVFNNFGNVDMQKLELYNDNIFIANGKYGIVRVGYSGQELQTGVAQDKYTGTNVKALTIGTYTPNIIFTAEGTDGIGVYTSTFSDITSVLNYTTNLNDVYEIKAYGDYVYVLDSVRGLVIFEYDDSAQTLTEQSSYITGTEPYQSIYVKDASTLYLAHGTEGFEVISISDPINPTQESTYDINANDAIVSDVYVHGDKVFVAETTNGLIRLNITASGFEFASEKPFERDQLHTYVECWNGEGLEGRDAQVQLNNWLFLDETDYQKMPNTETYNNYIIRPKTTRGLRNQWFEDFLRPIVYSSTDTALKFDLPMLVYLAEQQQPVVNFRRSDLYHQPEGSTIHKNVSFIYSGNWNNLYNDKYAFQPGNIYITHSLPGSPQHEAHEQQMTVEPTTGMVVTRKDRMQYNTHSTFFIEHYQYLNETRLEEYVDELIADNPNLGSGDKSNLIANLKESFLYRTWHTSNPGLTGSMGTLFWKEEVYEATEKWGDDTKEQFINRINTADSYRTYGAFIAMALLTAGFIVTSVVLDKTKPKSPEEK